MKHLLPVGDTIVCKKHSMSEKSASGIILPDSMKPPGNYLKVVAVASSWIDKQGQMREPPCMVDDIIQTWHNYGMEVKLDGEDFILAHFEQVAAVVIDLPEIK